MNTSDDRAAFQIHRSTQSIRLGSDSAAFEASLNLITHLNQFDYSYLWNWMGLPIIQFPADVLATQEVIWETRPEVIIETGVARGGSLVFMASILSCLGEGTVVGVDVDIRAHNRESIEAHPLSHRIKLIEGDSTSSTTLEQVRALVAGKSRVMVVLDSDHSREHVLAECRAYSQFVSPGCYLVVADTVVGHISEEMAPKNRSKLWFQGDEPLSAVNDFLAESDEFVVDPILNGKLIMSSSPGGYLIRQPRK